MRYKKQKGASILLTILIMAALLVIAVGISRLSIGEIKLSQDIEKSLTAYYAADAGVEAALYEERSNASYLGVNPFTLNGCLDEPSNNICYNVQVTGSVNNDPSDRLVQSKGSFKDIQRAIELSY